MSDNNGFRGDTRNKTWISLVVLFQEVHVADTLGLVSVGSQNDVIDRTQLLFDDIRSIQFDLQRVIRYW